jgi:hypothetical protein
MRETDRRIQLSRRVVLRGSAAALPAAAAGGMAGSPVTAWAQAARNLNPATLATLARAARDIYPHDSFPDSVYMTAVGGYDAKAQDPALRKLLEEGVAALDAESQRRYGRPYAEVIPAALNVHLRPVGRGDRGDGAG